jgi:hypothetical protein
MFKKVFLTAVFLGCMLIKAKAQHAITLASLLKELASYESVARWPSPYFDVLQASSYDRKSVSPEQQGWFANADFSQFIRTEVIEGRKEHVMLDADGPGAIVRFWLTTFKREGNIRIYFDDNKLPVLTIPGYDLMKSGLPIGKALLAPHSSYEPVEKGGSTLYLPMPFSKHCKITWEDLDESAKQPHYYQINYRKYAVGTKVQTFSLADLNTNLQLAGTIDKRLLHPEISKSGSLLKKISSISAGSQMDLSLPAKAHAIKQLSIKISTDKNSNADEALRKVMLAIQFDGQQTVWCPVSDFSGSGTGRGVLNSWYRTVTENGTLICRWIMPYKNSAKVSLINLNDRPVSADMEVLTTLWKWDQASMYFHADWKNEENVRIKQSEADGPMDWDFSRISGKGIYVGDTFAVVNHMHKWYGEGDQKMWTDSSPFPVEYGTGTEDYYNTSWAPVIIYQTPSANAPRADNPDSFGNNTFTRTRNLDAVPFNKNFRLSLETLGWENGTADFAATTYWYGTSAPLKQSVDKSNSNK